MTATRLRLVGGLAAILLCAVLYGMRRAARHESPTRSSHGSREVFLRKYLQFRAQQLEQRHPATRAQDPLGQVKDCRDPSPGWLGTSPSISNLARTG